MRIELPACSYANCLSYQNPLKKETLVQIVQDGSLERVIEALNKKDSSLDYPQIREAFECAYDNGQYAIVKLLTLFLCRNTLFLCRNSLSALSIYEQRIKGAMPPLHFAALLGCPKSIEWLLTKGANPYECYPQQNGTQPYNVIIYSDCQEIFWETHRFSYNGQQISIPKWVKMRAFFSYSESCGTKYPSPSQSDYYMRKAISLNDTPVVEELLKLGVNPNHEENSTASFIDHAVAMRSFEALKVLLKAGGILTASLRKELRDDRLSFEEQMCLKILCEMHGVDEHHAAGIFKEELDYVVQHKLIALIEPLHRFGFDSSPKMLNIAADMKDFKTVELLIKLGVRPDHNFLSFSTSLESLEWICQTDVLIRQYILSCYLFVIQASNGDSFVNVEAILSNAKLYEAICQLSPFLLTVAAGIPKLKSYVQKWAPFLTAEQQKWILAAWEKMYPQEILQIAFPHALLHSSTLLGHVQKEDMAALVHDLKENQLLFHLHPTSIKAAFTLAYKEGKTKIVKLLIQFYSEEDLSKFPPDLSIFEDDKMSPLQFAVRNHYREGIEWLLEMKADPFEAAESKPYSFIKDHRACESTFLKHMRFPYKGVQEFSFDQWLTQSDGGKEKSEALIAKFGEEYPTLGARYLCLAMFNNDLSMIELLLSIGITPDIKSIEGKTLTDRALLIGDANILALFLKAGGTLNFELCRALDRQSVCLEALCRVHGIALSHLPQLSEKGIDYAIYERLDVLLKPLLQLGFMLRSHSVPVALHLGNFEAIKIICEIIKDPTPIFKIIKEKGFEKWIDVFFRLDSSVRAKMIACHSFTIQIHGQKCQVNLQTALSKLCKGQEIDIKLFPPYLLALATQVATLNGYLLHLAPKLTGEQCKWVMTCWDKMYSPEELLKTLSFSKTLPMVAFPLVKSQTKAYFLEQLINQLSYKEALIWKNLCSFWINKETDDKMLKLAKEFYVKLSNLCEKPK